MPILSAIGAASSRAYGFNGLMLVPGNSGVLTSGTSFNLPNTSGRLVTIICIGGGGGGGGGSSRPVTPAGSGGGGGDIRYVTIAVTPGQTITYDVGDPGNRGAARDGIYSSGASGGAGGTTSVTVNGTVVCTAPGGGGGAVAYTGGGGGDPGFGGIGTRLLTPDAGVTATDGGAGAQGGNGARGYIINTSVGVTTLATYGVIGAGGYGNSGTAGVTGTLYGGGGGGGGVNATYDSAGYNPAPGGTGAVFIYWGY